MKQFILTGILALVCCLGTEAQNQILQQINSIKAQKDIYYWSQYAHINPDTARVNATRWILIDINDQRPEDRQLSFEDIVGKVKHIKMLRGNVTRNFTYIKKSDVCSNNSPIVKTDDNVVTIPAPMPKTFVPDMFIQRILQYNKFQAVYNFLRLQKADGKIAMFGPLTDVDDYSSLDLIVFDLQSQEVISVLSGAVPPGCRTNLVTGAEDSLDNYPEDMVAVIYYIK